MILAHHLAPLQNHQGQCSNDISSSSIFDLLTTTRDMVFLKCGTFNFHGFGSSIFLEIYVQIIVAQVCIQIYQIPMAKTIKSIIFVF
jgi:hypothetical protein